MFGITDIATYVIGVVIIVLLPSIKSKRQDVFQEED